MTFVKAVLQLIIVIRFFTYQEAKFDTACIKHELLYKAVAVSLSQ